MGRVGRGHGRRKIDDPLLEVIYLGGERLVVMRIGNAAFVFLPAGDLSGDLGLDPRYLFPCVPSTAAAGELRRAGLQLD